MWLTECRIQSIHESILKQTHHMDCTMDCCGRGITRVFSGVFSIQSVTYERVTLWSIPTLDMINLAESVAKWHDALLVRQNVFRIHKDGMNQYMAQLHWKKGHKGVEMTNIIWNEWCVLWITVCKYCPRIKFCPSAIARARDTVGANCRVFASLMLSIGYIWRDFIM